MKAKLILLFIVGLALQSCSLYTQPHSLSFLGKLKADNPSCCYEHPEWCENGAPTTEGRTFCEIQLYTLARQQTVAAIQRFATTNGRIDEPCVVVGDQVFVTTSKSRHKDIAAFLTALDKGVSKGEGQ